jgi:nucleoside-diphosphate-sugar epimerase
VCNIGSGQATSLTQLFKHLQALFPQWNNSVIYQPPQEGDIKDSLADISQAKSLLGFSPAISLATGLRQLVSNEEILSINTQTESVLTTPFINQAIAITNR